MVPGQRKREFPESRVMKNERMYPKTGFNLIIDVNITIPRHEISLVSYFGFQAYRILYHSRSIVYLSFTNFLQPERGLPACSFCGGR